MNTHHHHSHETPHSRAWIIGIALNALFVAAEIIYGFQSHSLALLADAGHNASDVLGLCMAYGATILAKRETSERFTYGLQSASILASLANALLLLLAVGGIGWEALQRFLHPEEPAAMTVIIVAAVGFAINAITASLFHKGHSHDLNVHGAFVHMVADAAVSLGVVLSGVVILNTGWLWIDPVVSIVIVIVIVAGTWSLLRRSAGLALHAVPEHIDSAKVKAYLSTLEGVKELHDLHIWAMSTTGVALSAHLLMPSGHPGDAFIQGITRTLAQEYGIEHATLQIEIDDANAHCHSDCGHAH